MTGIYEISNPGVFAPTKRSPGCGLFHVSTQTAESFYNHAAVEVTSPPQPTPCTTPTNLDGSDMVRMSWPEADDVPKGGPLDMTMSYVPARLFRNSATRITLGEIQGYPITYCTIPDVID